MSVDYKDDMKIERSSLNNTLLNYDSSNQLAFLLGVISSNYCSVNRKDYYKAIKIITSLVEDHTNDLTFSDFGNFDYLEYLINKVEKEPLAVINNVNLIFALVDRFGADAMYGIFGDFDAESLLNTFNIIDHTEMRIRLLDFMIFIEKKIHGTEILKKSIVLTAKPELLLRIANLYLLRIENDPQFITEVFEEVNAFILSTNSETHRSGLMCLYYGLKGDVTEIISEGFVNPEYNFEDDRPETIEPMLLIYAVISERLGETYDGEMVRHAIRLLGYRTVSGRVYACRLLAAIFRASDNVEPIGDLLVELWKYARRAFLVGQVAACEAFAEYILDIPTSAIDLKSASPLVSLTGRVLGNSEHQESLVSALEVLRGVYVQEGVFEEFKELLSDVDIDSLEGDICQRVEGLFEEIE